MPAPVSVVIPTLNSASCLPATCDALLSGATDGLVRELVISDGGSSDGIEEIARELGATLVVGRPGRGAQIARGVAVAAAPFVLILHADTWLSDGWTMEARRLIEHYPERAGYFRLRFRAPGLAPRFVAGGANLRSRVLGLPYGDQGLVVARRTLDEAGGVPEVPLMEDVVLARRLKGRLMPLHADALTSADRYVRDGWTRRVALNLTTLARFAAGADPEDLVRGYDRVKRR